MLSEQVIHVIYIALASYKKESLQKNKKSFARRNNLLGQIRFHRLNF